MKKHPSKLAGLGWFMLVLAFLTLMFTVSYFLTAAFYHLTHLNPPALLVQVVNSVLGILLTVILVGTTASFARRRGWIPEMNVFRPIIEALEKIAQGDFSIRVNDQFQQNQIVSELANSVNKMALELDQMENMRQEFISNVSHEIMSPLTSIRGFAQALENDGLSAEERHHYLGIIQNESTRLSRITADLLKLAALESEQLPMNAQPYRLDNQIRSLVLACEPQWQAKALDMQIALDELEITADEDLLSQVWLNLITNSIKFTPPGGKISISLQPRDGQAVFTIHDSGPGIADSDQVHIFERFYKADPSRTRTNGGSGLGLSIAKKIVDLHRGTIEVESKLGEGAAFTVTLPLG